MSFSLPRFLAHCASTAALAGLLLSAGNAAAQARTTSGLEDSKLDIYGGYGFWSTWNNGIHGVNFLEIYNPNATASVSYYFTRHFGFQVEGGYFSLPATITNGICNNEPCSPHGQRVYTAEAGPVFRYPLGRWVPFAHVLGGGERLNGPYDNPLTWGYGITGGIGTDYVLPFFNNHLAVRPAQADFQFSQNQNGPLYLPYAHLGGLATLPAMKLSGGFVLRFGGSPFETGERKVLSLACQAAPSSIFAGQALTVTATPENLDPKKPSFYQWSASGGQVTQLSQSQGTAEINTAGLAPGDYTVVGKLAQGKHLSECNTSFSVRAIEPPTLSCTASPATIQTGGIAVVTAVGASSSNRALAYSYTSDYGLISGTGPQVQLSAAGVTAPVINVTCNVVDDLGKTAQAATQVAVMTPKAAVIAPIATSENLCGISFERDRRRPVRVDNEAKACLDDVALNLQRTPDARLVVVGNFARGERPAQGERRSLNVRQYLVEEKGIDAGRIESRYGTQTGRTVGQTLVPAGATFGDTTATVFDPASVKRTGQAYGKPHATPATPAATGRSRRRHRHRRS